MHALTISIFLFSLEYLSAGSRPCDKGGRGGGVRLQKKCFQPYGSQFGLKITGGGAGPPGPSPGSATVPSGSL